MHLGSAASLRGHLPLAERLAPYSPTAAIFVAVASLKAGQPQEIERAAVQALKQAPIRPEPLALLAIARQAGGDKAQAATLMSVAGGSGWREAVSNLWLFNEGLVSGDPVLAAMRGDALLRQNLFRDEVLAAFAQLASDPTGRKALADRLAAQPQWRSELLGGRQDLDSSGHEALLLAIRKRGSHVSEEEAAALVRRLLEAGRPTAAHKAWRQLTDAPRLLADGRFERLAERGARQPLVPFEWKILPLLSARVSTEPLNTGQGAELQIKAAAGTVGPIMKQVLVLRPGTYELAAELSQGSAGLRFAIECGERERRVRGNAEPANRAQRVEMTFDVPSGCQIQKLLIKLTGRFPTELDATVSAMTLSGPR